MNNPSRCETSEQDEMSGLIPVISLWQPWASLIFAKAKVHETRSFAPPQKYVGCTIGIHATAKFPAAKRISEELHELCIDIFGCSYNHTLPLGAILGTAHLSAAIPTEVALGANDDDLIAGNWRHGRFAWPLSDVRTFVQPIPAKGKQGWWKYQCTASSMSAHRDDGTHSRTVVSPNPL